MNTEHNQRKYRAGTQLTTTVAVAGAALGAAAVFEAVLRAQPGMLVINEETIGRITRDTAIFVALTSGFLVYMGAYLGKKVELMKNIAVAAGTAALGAGAAIATAWIHAATLG